jgi:hypothetical protein
MISRIDGQQRWAMVANHLVQGATYDGGPAPQFRAEHFEPWARENMTVFFSTRGDDDFVAGLNISGKIDEPGVEMVHYPYVQSASVGGSGDDLLIVYSTHRREKSCVGGRGAPAACHDSIRFLRLRDMPDPKRPAIYPNHFARYFGYGQATPQAQTYSVSNNQLTLLDRGSAGIETQGDTGCINLRFKWDGALGANDTRPVLAFGRSADRASPVGLVLRGTGGGAKLMLGDKPVADVARGAWTATRVCYDLARGRLTDGAAVLDLGAGKLDPRSYLGDNTLARRNGRLPDLVIDVAATSLEAGATK